MQSDPHPSGLALSERVRMMRDGILNYASMLLSGISSIILIPIFVKHLGAELYGLWLATFAISRIIGALEFGLSWSVTREVSANIHGQHLAETALFVRAAGQAYLLLGAAGTLFIAGAGVRLSPGLHLSSHGAATAPYVFSILASGFMADKLFSFSTAVLAGLRRFDVLNVILIVSTIVRVVGMIFVLLIGESILAVAGIYSLVMWCTALASLVVVYRLQPAFQLRSFVLRWKILRPHMSFGINSVLTVFAAKAVWDSAPLMIGFVSGSAAIVPFQIGQRLSIAVSDFNWRVSEVLFPAAGAQHKAGDLPGIRSLLEFGTRWSIVLTLPLCLLQVILAPELLSTWIGNPPPESILILRIMSTAILIEALGVGAHNLLLGRGAAGTICIIHAFFGALMLVISFVLLKTIGIAGPAVAILLFEGAISVSLLYTAAKSCGTTDLAILAASFRGLLLPTAATVVWTLVVTRLVRPVGWIALISTLLSAGLVYAICLYYRGAREEERELVRNFLRRPVSAARWAYIWIRGHRPIVE